VYNNIIYSPPRGNRSHYDTYIIIIVNCYFFSLLLLQLGVSLFLPLFLITIRLCSSRLTSARLLRVHRISQLPSGRATIIISYILYAVPVYRGFVRHTQHRRRRPSTDTPSAWRPVNTCIRRVYAQLVIVRDSTRVSDGHARIIYIHDMFPSSVVKFKTLPLGPSLDPSARICHDRQDKSPRLFFNPRRGLRVTPRHRRPTCRHCSIRKSAMPAGGRSSVFQIYTEINVTRAYYNNVRRVK